MAESKDHLVPIGVLSRNESIGLLGYYSKDSKGYLYFSWSEDGVSFETDTKRVRFMKGRISHSALECSHFRFSYAQMYIATYIHTVNSISYICVAQSKDLYTWEVVSETEAMKASSVLVADRTVKKERVLYHGGAFIRCLTSRDLKTWSDADHLLATSRYGMFDERQMNLIQTMSHKDGILLLYETKEYQDDVYSLCIGSILFDRENPRRILSRSRDPIWKSDMVFPQDVPCTLIGSVSLNSILYVFWSTPYDLIIAKIDNLQSIVEVYRGVGTIMTKHEDNPIKEPHPHHAWENESVCNPAALYDGKTIHLLYRAMGGDGISRIGYDSSKDGINFNGSLPYPIYAMKNPRMAVQVPTRTEHMNTSISGGSWGGAEDPRAVRIDGKIYVTFNAFDGWDFIRICTISIDEKDFKKKKWNWSQPVFISPPHEIHKNWVLFPEKINGKFAVIHSINPRVQIDYFESFEDFEKGKKKIRSTWGTKVPRESWDTWVRGAGPPPLKTDKGWLVFYHAMDKEEPHIGYKLGALLLDLDNPEKIIARAKAPVLCPDQWYENEHKFGVVYACGAVVKDNTLFIYYGGGDRHVCVATAPFDTFMEKLVKDVPLSLNQSIINRT